MYGSQHLSINKNQVRGRVVGQNGFNKIAKDMQAHTSAYSYTLLTMGQRASHHRTSRPIQHLSSIYFREEYDKDSVKQLVGLIEP